MLISSIGISTTEHNHGEVLTFVDTKEWVTADEEIMGVCRKMIQPQTHGSMMGPYPLAAWMPRHAGCGWGACTDTVNAGIRYRTIVPSYIHLSAGPY